VQNKNRLPFNEKSPARTNPSGAASLAGGAQRNLMIVQPATVLLLGNLGIRLIRPLARRTPKDQWRGPRLLSGWATRVSGRRTCRDQLEQTTRSTPTVRAQTARRSRSVWEASIAARCQTSRRLMSGRALPNSSAGARATSTGKSADARPRPQAGKGPRQEVGGCPWLKLKTHSILI